MQSSDTARRCAHCHPCRHTTFCQALAEPIPHKHAMPHECAAELCLGWLCRWYIVAKSAPTPSRVLLPLMQACMLSNMPHTCGVKVCHFCNAQVSTCPVAPLHQCPVCVNACQLHRQAPNIVEEVKGAKCEVRRATASIKDVDRSPSTTTTAAAAAAVRGICVPQLVQHPTV